MHVVSYNLTSQIYVRTIDKLLSLTIVLTALKRRKENGLIYIAQVINIIAYT